MSVNLSVGCSVASCLVRIGGVPADGLWPAPAALGSLLERHASLRDQLCALRSQMVAILHQAILHAERPLRSHLLAIKRDCFNGRPLARHCGSDAWSQIGNLAGGLAEQILTLEEAAEAVRQEILAACTEIQLQEERALLDLARHPTVRRGLAVASPELAARLSRYEDYRQRKPRKARGLRLSLLRYISRAAFKISPYSTLTRVGVGRWTDAGGSGGLGLVQGEWRESSTLRVERYLLDQCSAVLALLPAYRDRLPVLLNPTVEALGEDRYRFLVPARWIHDAEAGALVLKPESWATVRLAGSLVPWLLSSRGDRQPFEGLLGRARAAFPERDAASLVQELEKLVEIGFLTLLPPWYSDAPVAERALSREVEQLLADGCVELASCAVCLKSLVALEEEFATHPEPVASLRRLEDLLEGLWIAVCGAAGIEPALRRPRLPRGNYYEDVTVTCHGDAPAGALLEVPRHGLEKAFAGLQPIADLTHIYDQRGDFLLTAGALCASRWGRRRSGTLLELCAEILPLWKEFRRSVGKARREGCWRTTFNPLDHPDLAALARSRESLWEQLEGCLVRGDDGDRLDPQVVASLVADRPRAPHCRLPPCAFLQPLDARGERWVLNRVAEGGGRFGSRFSAVLPGPLRDAFCAALRQACLVEVDGEPAELVDLFAVRGDTLNVHEPLTPRAIELPGERLSPRQGGLRLNQLRVSLRGDPPVPVMTDARGRRLLPMHLGGAGHVFMPSLVRLLTLFGPGQYRPVFPVRAAENRAEGVFLRQRLWCGSVLLQRRRWTVEAAALPAISERSPERVLELDAWRRTLGLPERIFVQERRRHGPSGRRVKPQLIQCGSPQFGELFASIAKQVEGTLQLEEMLPEPDQYLEDSTGARWALEVLAEGTLCRGGASRM